MTKRRAALILVAAISLVGVGFWADGEGFLGNVLAAGLEILLTVTIIDWLIRRGVRRRWSHARGHILLSITHHMARVAHEFMAHLEGDEAEELMTRHDLDGAIAEGYDYPVREADLAIGAMAELMIETGHELLSREGAEGLHESIRWDLLQVRGSLMPMVAALGDEPELAGSLSEFDHAARRWTSHFPLDDFAAAYHYIDAVHLMEATSRLYSCSKRLFDEVRAESEAARA